MMKTIVNPVRVLVGLLFIFSGLVKAIDPLGLSYKMQEFFELWGMTDFNQYTLWLSVLMIAFEIIAGVALLLGWQMRIIGWLLLLLIIFFTFLTGYAYLSGKFKNCGCFGDCIPITPLTSFLKDVALTLLIILLFVNRDKIRPLFSGKVNGVLMTAATIFSFGLQWYALTYLPPVDCLPFRKGNNISEKLKIPEGAVPDSFAIRFVYEKDGKEYEFAPAELPADLDTYNYVSRTDKLIRKGNAEPPIKGFALAGFTDSDSTKEVLAQPYAILVFCENFSTPFEEWKDGFTSVYDLAGKKNIPVYVITNRPDEAKAIFPQSKFSGIQIFRCDYTAIRTAARAIPTIYLLNSGTILDKQSHKRIDLILDKLESLPAQEPAPVMQHSMKIEFPGN